MHDSKVFLLEYQDLYRYAGLLHVRTCILYSEGLQLLCVLRMHVLHMYCEDICIVLL